jgi:hypothetical protein
LVIYPKEEALPQKVNIGRSTCGFGIALSVSNAGLNRIAWVSASRCVIWTTEAIAGHPIFMVDLHTRTVQHLLGDLRGMPITDVAFSESRKYIAIIINGFIVTFLETDGSRPLATVSFPARVNMTWRSNTETAILVT